jgi:hypothetical protein
MPTYHLADLGWQIAGGHSVLPSSILVLLAWTVGVAALAFLAYLRPTRVSVKPSRKRRAVGGRELHRAEV